MRPTSSGYVAESDSEALSVVLAAEMQGSKINMTHRTDDYQNVLAAFQRYENFRWKQCFVLPNGKKASLTASYEECTLCVRRNGLAIVSVATDLVSSVIANVPGFAKCPIFEDGEQAHCLFKSRGTFSGTFKSKVGELLVQSVCELVVGFESFEEFLPVPPERGLVWIRTPGRRSLIPNLPLDIVTKIEVE
jgi:hypothetical protein